MLTSVNFVGSKTSQKRSQMPPHNASQKDADAKRSVSSQIISASNPSTDTIVLLYEGSTLSYIATCTCMFSNCKILN